MANVYLLTGEPGSGKTTLIRQVLSKTKIKAGGFYTDEIRDNSSRQGFKISTLDGQESILAHTETSSPFRVSKYGVDIDNLDKVGVSALHQAIKESDLIVIDEIGKMELFSPRFKQAVMEAIGSGKKVLGTIMLNPHPFADEIKHHPGVKLVQLSRYNNDQVLREIVTWLELTIDETETHTSR